LYSLIRDDLEFTYHYKFQKEILLGAQKIRITFQVEDLRNCKEEKARFLYTDKNTKLSIISDCYPEFRDPSIYIRGRDLELDHSLIVLDRPYTTISTKIKSTKIKKTILGFLRERELKKC